MSKKTYYNEKENKWYIGGRSITRRISEHEVFTGVPTEEQLKAWGYEEFVPPQVGEELNTDNYEEDNADY